MLAEHIRATTPRREHRQLDRPVEVVFAMAITALVAGVVVANYWPLG